MPKISKILVANRGEIALRVMETARALGLGTVAVFSDADAEAPFVRRADEAIHIGEAASRDSYLRPGRVIEAAKRTGADAIHPGYGFLSESADFALAVAAAGLVFIGPPARVIRALGRKDQAKAIARQAGVPVIPGYDGVDQSDERLIEEARQVGFPLLVKACAGGGGKGMRIVREEIWLKDAIAAARREAEGAFGDSTLLLERYLERPRHVELQILGDSRGNLVHLFERECSIQRRHQKIIEECPSPAVDVDLRAQMGTAAVALGRAVGYESAGTVEFLLDADRRFYFLEVNTRLQVEHRVTERVVGLDLVEQQLRIARGEALSFRQQDLQLSGWALECRLVAEDPASGHLPQSGRLYDLHLPELPGISVDTGVESGSPISIHYDPLLAKVVSHGRGRVEAIDRMALALSELAAQGIKTNRRMLLEILDHPAFRAGDLDTHFLERHFVQLEALAEERDPLLLQEAALAACVAGVRERRRTAKVLPELRPGFRNNPLGDQKVRFEVEGGERLEVAYRALDAARFEVKIGNWQGLVRVHSDVGRELCFEEGGHRRRLRVVSTGERWLVQSKKGSVSLLEVPRFQLREAKKAAGACVAPMPGRVVLAAVDPGQAVQRGMVLVVLEAMKMEHPVTAPEDGVVLEIRVRPGDQVSAGDVLAVVGPAC